MQVLLTGAAPLTPIVGAPTLHKDMKMDRLYSIVLADGHQMVREGVRKIIEEKDGFHVVGEASDGRQLLEITKSTIPDLVIVDISIPNLREYNAIKEIKGLGEGVKVLFLSMHDHPEYLDYALEHGVEGFVIKQNVDLELHSAIDKIRRGETYVPSVFQGQLTRWP
jgi:DNA-binding NarL/FixJ family response regulator